MRISGIVFRLSLLVATMAFAGCYARDGGREEMDASAPLLDKSNEDAAAAEPFAYFEDFHADPGWSVSDPEKFYWDPSCECFFLTMEGGTVTHDYAYVDLSDLGFEFGPFRLTYEIQIVDLTWGAFVGMMLLMDNLDFDRAAMTTYFGYANEGPQLHLSVFAGPNVAYTGEDAWTPDVWVTHEIVWDGADITLTERLGDGVRRVLQIPNADVFELERTFLGFSTVGFDLYPESYGHARIDNLRLTTIAPTN